MSSAEETIDNLRLAIAEPLGVIADPKAGRFLGPAIEEFEDLAIAVACIHLFERADVEAYGRGLQLCGFARQHFLRRTRSPMDVDDVYSAASRAQGDLAAFIAGDDALLMDIVARTATGPLGGEYEEDFWYRKILHALMSASGQIDNDRLALLIDEFERTRRGKESSRSALCVAFRDDDRDEFWSSFSMLHAEVEEQRASPVGTDDPWPGLYRRLWLEGLVWLAIANGTRGWPSPEADYPLCPSWARRQTSEPAGENIFAAFPIRN
jgi:hypothetical protein